MSRSVLCKSVAETGITFFTNYDSAKGVELAANPYASATFPWFALGRQVHVRGAVSKVTAQAHCRLLVQAPAWFAIGRVGVRASPAPIEVAGPTCWHNSRRSPNGSPGSTKVPVPPNWGGYLVAPRRLSSSGRAARTGCTTGSD